jgi:HlyD family secretion protein
MKRKHFVWLGAALLVALAVWAFMQPTILEVDAVEVVRAPLRVTIDEEGETRLRRRFVISAPVAGRVQRIDIRPGDRVTAGQRVAVIEPAAPTPLDARTRAAAEARVRAAEASGQRAIAERQRLAGERQQAEADLARSKGLFDAGYGTREAVEQATVRLQSLTEAVRGAEAVVRASEFELAEARAALLSGAETDAGRAVVVTAPTAGLILRRLQESAAVVPAGAPLLELGNLDDLEIVTDLLSTDAVKVESGDKVSIERWGGEGSLAGVVQRVEPGGFMKISALGVEEQRVNVVIDFVDPRERRESLGDGYRVEVRITIWEKADALTVPTSSLFRSEGEWAVFVIDGDVVRRRIVKIGERNEQAAEVLEGLSAGDRVVAYPGESLTDGAQIRVRGPSRP